MKIKHIFSFAFFITFSPVVFAAQNMKPGLWEHSFTMKSQSGKVEQAMLDMKKQMAAMPADQRKMMESMMAKQGMGLGLGKATNVNVCISKEQASKLEFPNNQNGHCKQEIMKRTANYVQMKFSCDGDPKTEGTAEFNLVNSTTYTGKAVINLIKDGKTDRMDMNSKGKWLSADCGNLKPYTPKK